MLAPSLPSKSKCLRALRRVYPGAHFAASSDTEGFSIVGHGIELRYVPPGTREAVPVLTVRGPSAAALPFAALRGAFLALGFETVWSRSPFPGGFIFSPVKDYEGIETRLPVELDPNEPDPESDENKSLTKVGTRQY